MATVATGTSANEMEAHLVALEAFLDHPDHADRRLAIDVEDTAAGRELTRFAAQHLPRIPVTTQPDIRACADHISPELWAALSELLKPLPAPEPPRTPVRIVAATGNSDRVFGQAEAGWAWVTNNGRWRTGTIRNRKAVAVDLIALARLISSFPDADSIHIGCSSKQALGMIQQMRSRELGITKVSADLALQHPRYQVMFDAVVNHPGDITFQWLSEDPRHVLTFTADRLAVQARQALQSDMPSDAFAAIQANIIADLEDALSRRRSADRHRLP